MVLLCLRLRKKYANFAEFAQNDHEYLIKTLTGRLFDSDMTVDFGNGNSYKIIQGTQQWQHNKKLHRRNAPALIGHGAEEWWRGQRHRTDGPAVKTATSEVWWYKGKKHRIDGPAVVEQGLKEWWVNGELHRLDGPAIEYSYGRTYYLHGVEMSKADWKLAIEELAKKDKKPNKNPELS